jgi:hypothetical protein
MQVIFENKDLEDLEFIGVFGKNQNVVQIANAIKSTGGIHVYEINNKTITLK